MRDVDRIMEEIEETSLAVLTGEVMREAQPLARALFFLLRDRPQDDQMVVFRSLSERFPMLEGTEQQHHAVRSLRACLAGGGEISRASYKRWYDAEPTPNSWSSPWQVGEAFDTWQDARAAAGDPKLDPVALRSIRTYGFEFNDCDDAVRLWASENEGDYSHNGYEAWARKERAKANPRLQGRIPKVAETLLRHLEAADWPSLLAQYGWLSHFAASWANSKGRVRMPMGRDELYETPRLLQWVRRASQEHGPFMTPTRYQAFADAHNLEMIEGPVFDPAPASKTISERFDGIWPRALFAAGLISAEQAAELVTASGDEFSDEEVWDAMSEAMVKGKLGPKMSPAAFDAYREERRYEMVADGRRPKFPSASTAIKRNGKWVTARERALQRGAAGHVEGLAA